MGRLQAYPPYPPTYPRLPPRTALVPLGRPRPYPPYPPSYPLPPPRESLDSQGNINRKIMVTLRQEAEDNGCPASPVPHLPRSPSECRPPNAPLLRRAVLPPHVVRSRVRTRGRAPSVAPVARQIPAVEYPLKMGDDDYGGDLMDQHAAARPQLPLFLPVCPSPGPAPSPSSDAA